VSTRHGANNTVVRDLPLWPHQVETLQLIRGFIEARAGRAGKSGLIRGSRTPPSELHYGDTAYLVSPSSGVFSMATLEQGARTRAGVGVGDELEGVRVAYADVQCGEATAGEAVFGESPSYQWCRALVGGVRVFFGGDPIESITLTSYER
jgi:hypothetical protein